MSKKRKTGQGPKANDDALRPEELMTPESRRNHVAEAMRHAAGSGEIVNPSPLTYEFRVVDGRLKLAKRIRDGLDIMRDNETINDRMLMVVRRYQDDFEIAHKEDVRAVDWNGTGGGGGYGREEFLTLRMRARDRINAIHEKLGGLHRDNIGALAVYYILGYRRSINDMVRDFSHSAHWWRGGLIAAINVMVAHEESQRKDHDRIRVARDMKPLNSLSPENLS